MTEFSDRLNLIAHEIGLPDNYSIRIDGEERPFVQIQCWRRDVITGEMGYGRGGKAHPSEHATDSELVSMIFGLYQAYVIHEARETFEYRGRRVYGPHIDVNALWEVARRVDVRSAMHLEDAQ